MSTKGEKFSLKFSNFNVGAAPLAHLDVLTQVGNGGHFGQAQNIDIISYPSLLTQGPGLVSLTAGTEAGAVGELMNFIYDRAITSGITYGIAATKLHQISPTAVTNAGIWPHTITGAAAGSSVINANGFLYYFWNGSGATGDCGRYDLTSTFVDAYFSSAPSGAGSLVNAPHPAATKQNIILFGNGRYVGVFFTDTVTLNTQRLDFGVNASVADIVFNANQWMIAVNVGSGVSTDRQYASIFLYDPSASTAQLIDELAVGAQKIGFLIPVEGIVYVAYQDLTSAGGFCIGYINGRAITPLRYFTGTLPTFAQKFLYNNTIAFISNGQVYSVGAVVETLPVQISPLASGGYSTVGAAAAPFGTPMIASTQSTSFKVAKFSGFDVNANWRSIVIPTVSAKMVGFVDSIVVMTNQLGTGARCDLIVEANQGGTPGATLQITGSGKRRHTFNAVGLVSLEDFRMFLNWANGSTANPVKIRQIEVAGHFVEKS